MEAGAGREPQLCLDGVSLALTVGHLTQSGVRFKSWEQGRSGNTCHGMDSVNGVNQVMEMEEGSV